jgi:transposase
VHRFEEEGMDSLKDRKGRGRHSILTEEQLLRIKLLILNDAPLKYGFQSEKWTGPMLIQWIKNEYGVEYQKAQVYNLLSKVGIAFEKRKSLIEMNFV